ncbi:MAG: hypothetical protein FVQ84_00005 [Planctomycetes bacterium]|nr:hypothetical protein [Planctomycetota bacterium]
MALTPDKIKAIEQAADALDKWRTDVIDGRLRDLGCWLALRVAFESQVDKAVDILLKDVPELGKDLKAECNKLLSGAKLVEDLREENAPEARIKEIELLGPARRLISRLQQIAQIEKEKLSSEKPAETEQKEIVEVKPGVFGISVNIKELARRFWKRVCSRSKD